MPSFCRLVFALPLRVFPLAPFCRFPPGHGDARRSPNDSGFNLRGATYLPGAGDHADLASTGRSSGNTATAETDTAKPPGARAGLPGPHIDYSSTSLARPTPFTSTRMQAKLSTLAAAPDCSPDMLHEARRAHDSAYASAESSAAAAAAGSPGRSKRERYGGLVGFKVSQHQVTGQQVTGQVSVSVSAKRPHNPSADRANRPSKHSGPGGAESSMGATAAGRVGAKGTDTDTTDTDTDTDTACGVGPVSVLRPAGQPRSNSTTSTTSSTTSTTSIAAALGRRGGKKRPRDRNHRGVVAVAVAGGDRGVVGAVDPMARLQLLPQRDTFLTGRPAGATARAAHGHGRGIDHAAALAPIALGCS